MKNKKNEFKTISSYKPVTLVFFVLTDFSGFLTAVQLIVTILRDFFFIQINRKLGLKKTPIAKVDNELDKKIPFDPSKVNVYLGFIGFWINPLCMLIKRLGRKKAKPYVISFLRKITLAYKSAAQVYRICMTTTDRPHYHNTLYFRLIHFFDPHYLCVPSLHIAVVTLVWIFYREIFNEIDEFSQDEKNAYLEEIYRGTIQISETVLFIKQHSVNCIPAALYMINHLMPSHLDANDAIQILHDLFINTDVSEEDQKELKDYMYFMFERFLLTGTTDDNWILPIKDWLKEYCKAHNQSHIAEKIK